jgi:hypothetical protein
MIWWIKFGNLIVQHLIFVLAILFLPRYISRCVPLLLVIQFKSTPVQGKISVNFLPRPDRPREV